METDRCSVRVGNIHGRAPLETVHAGVAYRQAIAPFGEGLQGLQ